MNRRDIRNPMSTDNLSELYDATTWYWDSRFYNSVYRQSYFSLFEKLDRRAWLKRPPSRLRVLDCGIGTGLLSSSFIAAVDRSVDLAGVDTSPRMLEHARRRLSDKDGERRLMLGDICRLPFADREMDLVMAALVLEHVRRPVDALREMARVARPNATILLIATRVGAPDWPFRLWFRYQPFPQERLLQWMMEAGLQNLCVEPLSGFGRPFAQAYIGSASI
jgi:ubiquinone/menaquinone biosynthesis C-methylase UbiE